jgi:hypothetical protein
LNDGAAGVARRPIHGAQSLLGGPELSQESDGQQTDENGTPGLGKGSEDTDAWQRHGNTSRKTDSPYNKGNCGDSRRISVKRVNFR